MINFSSEDIELSEVDVSESLLESLADDESDDDLELLVSELSLLTLLLLLLLLLFEDESELDVALLELEDLCRFL